MMQATTLPSRGGGFEYLDHTADVLLHAAGDTLNEAFEMGALGMLNYMTDVAALRPDDRRDDDHNGADDAEATAVSLSSTSNTSSASSDSVTVSFELVEPTLEKLYFSFLNEILTEIFGVQHVVPYQIRIPVLDRHARRFEAAGHNDATTTQSTGATESGAPIAAATSSCYLKCVCVCARWRDGRTEQRTEVKAVTMHGLKVLLDEEDMRFHAYVVLDI